jgi:23S rRNA U2552 (ribose-2'-O)-methylase RlmE/FtsJ
MNPASRLARELGQLAHVLDATEFARYMCFLIVRSPSILADRTLVPADRLMNSDVAMTVGGKRIVVPVGEITALIDGHDPTPTFGAMREMYAGNVYLAPFEPGFKARTVVDLGSNRGLFSILAAIVLGAETVVGIEPSTYYQPVLARLIEANGLDARGVHRIAAFASSEPGPGKVTIDEIMDRFGMERIEFLKCDIEGGEFDVFLRNNAFLAKVDRIAMELHPTVGDVAALRQALTESGFNAKVTDQFGDDAPAREGLYLFASRVERV